VTVGQVALVKNNSEALCARASWHAVAGQVDRPLDIFAAEARGVAKGKRVLYSACALCFLSRLEAGDWSLDAEQHHVFLLRG
jgi:hypothetical protein